MQDNIKLFSKRQLVGAQRARELHERLLCPSTPDYKAIVSAGCVPGSDVTLDDVKAFEVIWGRSVLKMKGNVTMKNGKRMTQSIVKVPTELIKLHKNVELGAPNCGLEKYCRPSFRAKSLGKGQLRG